MVKKKGKKETVWEQLDRIQEEVGRKWHRLLSREFKSVKTSETP